MYLAVWAETSQILEIFILDQDSPRGIWYRVLDSGVGTGSSDSSEQKWWRRDKLLGRKIRIIIVIY